MKQKTIILTIILVMVLIIVATVVAVWLVERNSPKESITLEEYAIEETDEEKIFTNEQAAFQISFPKNWHAEVDDGMGTAYSPDFKLNREGDPPMVKSTNGCEFEWHITEFPATDLGLLSAPGWARQQIENCKNDPVYMKENHNSELIYIAGYPALKKSWAHEGFGDSIMTELPFGKNVLFIDAVLSYESSESCAEQFNTILEKITIGL